MNFTKTMFALTIGSAGMVGSISAYATAVMNGDVLALQSPTFDANGYVVLNSGSYFAMDVNGNGLFGITERSALSNGTLGLLIGSTTSAGPSHGGAPLAYENNTIDRPWYWFANTGSHFLATPVTGNTTTGLDFSGWRVTWNGIPSINMGGGIQNCGTATDGICVIPSYDPYTPPTTQDLSGSFNNGSGIATFAWDGVYGHTYTVDYMATVPQADPSGFGGVGYQLHLQGTVIGGLLPEASTYGMMLVGLGLVGLAVRRRQQA